LDLLDGEWNAVKQERLDELLRGDATARAQYREMMAMHAMLDAEFSGSLNLNDDGIAAANQSSLPPLVQVVDGKAASDFPKPANIRANRWLSSLGWITAAVVAASVGAWTFFPNGEHRGDRQPVVGSEPGETSRPEDGSAPEDTAIAVVTRVIRPQWAKGAGAVRPGQSLGKQWIKLETGIVQIEFRSGARVTLEGPAQLRLDSEADCFVQAGKLTVLAPPSAANFTVKSSASDVIDLGTEFGMIVNESGELDVHVLDGEVEVAVKESEDRSAARQKLVEQQAATVRRGRTAASRHIESKWTSDTERVLSTGTPK
jgi:hypothetical protein